MNIERRDLIEIVGLISVVLSLLFVGQQLRLDRSLALAEQYSARAESMKEDIRTRMESGVHVPNAIARWERGVRPSWWNEEIERRVTAQERTPSEIVISLLEQNLVYYQDDNLYFLYRQGLHSEEFWTGVQTNIKNKLAANPIARGIYTNRQIEREIDHLVRQLVAEIERE